MILPKRPFVVYTGNLYPHKNVGVLIAAVEKLKINLVIVCARSVFVNRLPKSEYVHYLGRLADSELIKVYKLASVFVFPSLIEGFGLPGLEAMAVGLPVISARTSCLPEIYGEAAMFFDPYSSDDLARKISQILNDKKIAQEFKKKGLAQVKKYSWTKMAEETWRIYQEESH